MAYPLEGRDTDRNGRGDGEPLRSELLREVNDRIREVGRDGNGAIADLEFLCECGAGGCGALVPLTTGEYDGIRLGSGLVLAVGHGAA